MPVLDNLEPKKVFHFFEKISAIPRGSGNTKAISDYLADFAKARGLEHYQDAVNNVIIIAPATPGYEQADAVIVQGHMDMVCQKAADCEKDMEREGLSLAVGEDFVYAKGTTLGADDGIAVAMALALLDSRDIPHPRLEVVVTVDEETSMCGAFGVDMRVLQGNRLLNIDSEVEGVLTISSAGGVLVKCRLEAEPCRDACAAEALHISISGLLGGHSGSEIHRGRANANLILGRLLYRIQSTQPVHIVSLTGGEKNNAICVSAQAVIVVSDPSAAVAVCRELEASLHQEYAACDDGIRIHTAMTGLCHPSLSAACSRKIIALLCAPPNGVQAMSPQIEGLVQTSVNLGVMGLHERENSFEAIFSVRSMIDSQKYMLADKLRCLAECLGAQVDLSDDYPGWCYRPESPLRDLVAEIYTEQYGYPPRIEALHAGLECGLFAAKRPGLDCVSFGPQIDDIHTPREKLYISSTQRTWSLLKEILRRMK